MNFLKPLHKKGILIKTWAFKECPYPEYKLRYIKERFYLFKYIPKDDKWNFQDCMEAWALKCSPVEWAEKKIDKIKEKEKRFECLMKNY